MRISRVEAGATWAGLTVAATLLAAPAQATEGYFQHGYGTVSKALGGAGVAFSQDAKSQVLNPAGLVFTDDLQTGPERKRGQLNFGVAFFSPRRQYDASGGSGPGVVGNESVQSDRELFTVPNIAASYQLDDGVSAIGVALYGNGGLNTTYDGDDATCTLAQRGVFCDGKTGVDLAQIFLQPTYAREIFDGVSIGLGPIFAAQVFEAQGLQTFGDFGFSSDPDNLSGNGDDYSFGIGARFGLQAELPANFRFGAAYQLRTFMTPFDDYAGLFADQGDFDIPPALQVGLAWQPVKPLTLLFDYRRIWYSQVDAVGNDFFIPSPGKRLGDSDGPGFGWDDVNAYKVGVQWDIDETWTLRAGYSYVEQPISSSEVLFNILAPGVIEHHITGGIEYRVDHELALRLSGFYAPSSTVSGNNPLDPGQEIELEMHQFEIMAGFTWRF